MYHELATRARGHRRSPSLYVSPSAFAAQVRALARGGYRAVTLERVFAAWHGRARLPARPIVLSFDDGYPSDVTVALPILRARRWPGVLNLQVGNLEARKVKVLLAAGWEVDAHTFTHPNLTARRRGPALARGRRLDALDSAHLRRPGRLLLLPGRVATTPPSSPPCGAPVTGARRPTRPRARAPLAALHVGSGSGAGRRDAAAPARRAPPAPARSRVRKWILIGAGVVLLLLVGLAAAFVLYRQHEGRNIHGSSSVEFVTTEPVKAPTPAELRTVPWPLYGLRRGAHALCGRALAPAAVPDDLALPRRQPARVPARRRLPPALLRQQLGDRAGDQRRDGPARLEAVDGALRRRLAGDRRPARDPDVPQQASLQPERERPRR